MPANSLAPVLPEVAFLGRSNVGKSSVINSLLGSKIAKTSSTPGRTRSINFFEVRWPGKPEPELVFTDLPGYGYAKISREISQQWPSFIDPYLKERPCLALCVALIDVNVPPQSADRQAAGFSLRDRTPNADRRHQERPAFGQPVAQRASDSGPGISRVSHSAFFRENRSGTPGTLAGNSEADVGPRVSGLGSSRSERISPLVKVLMSDV